MHVSSPDTSLQKCIGELLRTGVSVYTASSVEELTNLLEAISLSMEERKEHFTFSLDGLTVRFQIDNTP